MITGEEFEDWCRAAGRTPERELRGPDREWMDEEDYYELINCGDRIRYNKKRNAVSGMLEAIEFNGNGSAEVDGRSLEMEDATWNDRDSGDPGDGKLWLDSDGDGNVTLHGFRY